MKLLLILVVLFISSVSSTQFANFQGPFSENQCSKSIEGASYSVAINKCMINIGGFNDPVPIGNAFNWFLQLSGNQLEVQQYAHNETTCLYGLDNTTTLTVNECSQVPDFQQIQSSNFAQLSITNGKPITTPNTLTISQFNPQNFNCNINNLLWSVSFTNGYELDTSNAGSTSSTTFICKNGTPYFNNCFNGKCSSVEMSTKCDASNLQTITCN